MKKINLEICMGTTCFIMGASKLQNIERYIPSKYKDSIDIDFKTCLGLCQNNKYAKSPYVKLDNKVISEATVEKVINSVESEINEQ